MAQRQSNRRVCALRRTLIPLLLLLAAAGPSPSFTNVSISGTLGVTGAATFSGPMTLNGLFNQGTTQPAVTYAANSSCLNGSQYWCSFLFPSGTITGSTTYESITLGDVAAISGGVGTGFLLTMNIGPNGNTSSGSRTAFGVLMQQPSSAGTITGGGNYVAFGPTVFAQANLGGTSTVHAGSNFASNSSCQIYATATYTTGCVGWESDIGAYSGTNYQILKHFSLVETNNDQAEGQLGPDIGIEMVNQAGSTVGLSRGIVFGDNPGAFPMNAWGTMIGVEPSFNRSTYPTLTGAGIDVGLMTFKSFDYRGPFRVQAPLQATAITGVTRLTSDGAAANGFLLDAQMTNGGSSYTSEPSVAVTGCTGAVVHSALGLGGVVGQVGVYTAGSACIAETTLAISGGGGSSATAKAIVAGNTLNFPINSAVDVACKVTATTLTHSGTDAVGWSITFGATMGATSSTTAIVGSPTWTLDYQTSGAAAKFSGSSPAVPTADTTLGAINLSVTPTTGTWDVGGSCAMTKTVQL